MATTTRKTYLSVLISSILASSVSFAATAQQQEKDSKAEEDVEVIEVTGIRSSIKESNFRKKKQRQSLMSLSLMISVSSPMKT